MGRNGYTESQIVGLFSMNSQSKVTLRDLLKLEKSGKIPQRKKGRKTWETADLPGIGEKIGFLKKPTTAMISSVFVTKGGVLKTSLVMNLARMAALHNVRVCVIGLDMQGDITNTLGFESEIDSASDLSEALEKLSAIRGLPEMNRSGTKVESLLQPTDLPTLWYIPETPELVALEQQLTHKTRREFWLRDQVIAPLKDQFDWILIDCPPNWNQLITNALVASDLLISPLECKINNFRNLKMFSTFIEEFCSDMKLNLGPIFVPTRLNENRKLSNEIFNWYQKQVPNCTKTPVRESTAGEEAMALRLSVLEHQPLSQASVEMKVLMAEVWQALRVKEAKKKSLKSSSKINKKRLATSLNF